MFYETYSTLREMSVLHIPTLHKQSVFKPSVVCWSQSTKVYIWVDGMNVEKLIHMNMLYVILLIDSFDS